MRRTFKYRLLGNKMAFNKLDTWLYLCRYLYNVALSQRISIYRQNKGRIRKNEQQSQLPELKMEFPEYKEINSQTLQQVVERLDNNIECFFRRIKEGAKKASFPRFKSQNRYNSFVLKQFGWKLNGKYLMITNVGKFKIRLSRPVEGDIKTITIRKEHNNWYACFSCNNVPEKKLPKLDTIVGLDVGIKSFLVDSDGNVTDNPRYLKNSEAILRRRHKSFDRSKKGSKRKSDARILLSKAYEKVKNQRNDFLHKLSTQYVKNYGTLVFENLNIKGLVMNSRMSKAISDVGWGYFYEYCAYKAEEAGRQIIQINRFEPTSKTCSECGAINEKLHLGDRKWVCLSCGVLHDRDHNAAKNIKRVGQAQQALTCENTQSVACESPCNGIGECQMAYAYKKDYKKEDI
jgi:putative transposase